MCVCLCFFSIIQEILASVMIKNLDTGEEIPLIQAEEKLPAGINPLTLHIMRRTKEYITYAKKTKNFSTVQHSSIFNILWKYIL